MACIRDSYCKLTEVMQELTVARINVRRQSHPHVRIHLKGFDSTQEQTMAGSCPMLSHTHTHNSTETN